MGPPVSRHVVVPLLALSVLPATRRSHAPALCLAACALWRCWPSSSGCVPLPGPPCCPQTVVVYAATKGYLDKVPVSEISGCEDIILKHIDPRLIKLLKFKGKITPEVNAHLAAQMSTLPLKK